MSFLKLKNSIFKILIEIFVVNKSRRKIIKARWAKKHVRKYVQEAIADLDVAALQCEKTCDSKIIWQYWHQGEENAPLLIKKCFESVRKFHPDYEVKVLSFDTINDYVILPEKYYGLLKQGKIPIAIFSDILRLYLLRQYGGIWIDATIYLTDRLPEDILTADFMVMRKDVVTDAAENVMSCFFIRSKSNVVLLELIKSSIENYWRDNDYLINYFIFEHIATLIAFACDYLQKMWQEMPYYSAEDAGILQTKLFDEFDEAEFVKIKNITPIHKLTYKKSFDNVKDNSFYQWLINAGEQNEI